MYEGFGRKDNKIWQNKKIGFFKFIIEYFLIFVEESVTLSGQN